ncbi:hypothetical protein [Povalibacter sp.]|uniref:hypothetical protein n=1 Tax=Povalibacter sp. TaxID=1962978 RepID=UPI002D1FAB4C|nr:hypothetical protein [Povalibacter sp.]
MSYRATDSPQVALLASPASVQAAPQIDNVWAAALSLLFSAAAVICGLHMGRLLADSLPNTFSSGLKATAATISIAVFASYADKIIAALACAYRQLGRPAPIEALLEAAKLFVAFLALGFPVEIAAGEVTRIMTSTDTLRLQPVMVRATSDAPVVILPILFSKNAKLASEQANTALVPQSVLASDRSIWEEGTVLDDAGEQLKAIRTFLSMLVQCSDASAREDAVVVQVEGFASSREFETAKGGIRDDSDQLNLRAARDRGRAVRAVVRHSPEFEAGLVRMPREPRYDSMAAMVNRRIYIDRLPGLTLEDQEALTRRAEIRVLHAPGCAGSAMVHSAKPASPASDSRA